jgi:hypothetical protein
LRHSTASLSLLCSNCYSFSASVEITGILMRQVSGDDDFAQG